MQPIKIVRASYIRETIDALVAAEARVIRQGKGYGTRSVRVEFGFDSWADSHNLLMRLRGIADAIKHGAFVDSNG